jgi:hypothetical protein
MIVANKKMTFSEYDAKYNKGSNDNGTKMKVVTQRLLVLDMDKKRTQQQRQMMYTLRILVPWI